MTPPARKVSGEMTALRNANAMKEIVIKEQASVDVLLEPLEPTAKILARRELSDWTVLKNVQFAKMVHVASEEISHMPIQPQK